MQEVSSLGIRVQAAGFILLNPNADQLAREIVPLGEPIKGLPSNVLLHHLPLKLDAVRTLLSGHGFHLSKAQNTCQITNFNLSGSRWKNSIKISIGINELPLPVQCHEVDSGDSASAIASSGIFAPP